MPTISVKSLDLCLKKYILFFFLVKCREMYLYMHLDLHLNGIIVHFWQLFSACALPVHSLAQKCCHKIPLSLASSSAAMTVGLRTPACAQTLKKPC